MKKIMFDDNFGLTQSVLKGYKTKTRRIVSDRMLENLDTDECLYTPDHGRTWEDFKLHTPYRIGEIVAIAQAYSDIPWEHHEKWTAKGINLNVQKDGKLKGLVELAGWNNKMFVRADLMPRRVIIIDAKLERLQDISEEDCFKEGIVACDYPVYEGVNLKEILHCYTLSEWKDSIEDPWAPNDPSQWMADSPHAAFATLCTKMMGKKVWESNPYVIAYEHQLV